jgi:hypothetical protein
MGCGASRPQGRRATLLNMNLHTISAGGEPCQLYDNIFAYSGKVSEIIMLARLQKA